MISIVICTYNSPDLINKCVNSILKQKGVEEKIEILFVDGGSDNTTIDLLKSISRKRIKNIEFKIINNLEKIAEGKGRGKWKGFYESKGKLVGFIDQDNEFVREDTLAKVIKLMKKEKECFGFAHRLFLDKRENWINQTISLIGTDPILAYRSLDYLSNIGKLNFEKKVGYIVVKIPKEEIIITGGNCFFYRRKDLNKIGGYTQDVDNIYLLNKLNKNKIILLDEKTTNHRAIESFFEFLKKKRKYGKSYSNEKREFSYIPKTRIEKRNFIINLWKIIFILPLVVEKIIFSIKYKEPRHLLTIPLYYVCFFTYFLGILENFLKFRK